MEIKRLTKDELPDFKDLIEIFNHVFEKEKAIPNDQHLSSVLANPGILVFAVKSAQRVVGGLTLYILQSYM